MFGAVSLSLATLTLHILTVYEWPEIYWFDFLYSLCSAFFGLIYSTFYIITNPADFSLWKGQRGSQTLFSLPGSRQQASRQHPAAPLQGCLTPSRARGERDKLSIWAEGREIWDKFGVFLGELGLLFVREVLLHDGLSHLPEDVLSHNGDLVLLNLSLIGLCVGSIPLLDDLFNTGDCRPWCVGLWLADLYPGLNVIGVLSESPPPWPT